MANVRQSKYQEDQGKNNLDSPDSKNTAKALKRKLIENLCKENVTLTKEVYRINKELGTNKQNHILTELKQPLRHQAYIITNNSQSIEKATNPKEVKKDNNSHKLVRLNVNHVRSGIQDIHARAEIYISKIQPDAKFIKKDPGLRNEINDSPPYDCEDFLIVTEESRQWRREFETRERIQEGMVLLRPRVKMSILVALVISQSPDKMLMPQHIYTAIQNRFPYFLYMSPLEEKKWKSNIRHILSQKWFTMIEFSNPWRSADLRGHYHTLDIPKPPELWNLSASTIQMALAPPEPKKKDSLLGNKPEKNSNPVLKSDTLWGSQMIVADASDTYESDYTFQFGSDQNNKTQTQLMESDLTKAQKESEDNWKADAHLAHEWHLNETVNQCELSIFPSSDNTGPTWQLFPIETNLEETYSSAIECGMASALSATLTEL